jgi:hypothetical protein
MEVLLFQFMVVNTEQVVFLEVVEEQLILSNLVIQLVEQEEVELQYLGQELEQLIQVVGLLVQLLLPLRLVDQEQF